jgi:hypothetical protein
MTLKESMLYVTMRAKEVGYTDAMIAAFSHEIEELLYKLEECSIENLDILFDEVF